MPSADRRRPGLLAAAVPPLLGLALLAPPALADSLQAALSRDTVRVGETVELLLRYRPEGMQTGLLRPDLTALEGDFRILDTRRSQRTTVVNGRQDSSLDWVITLTPRQAGAASVPALRVGDARSAALSVQVSAAPTAAERAAATDLPDLFLEAELDRTDPYVQGQAVLTARIHDAAGMTAAALTDPQVPGAVVERLGEDRVFSARRGDRDYRVIERRYAVFPQSSGTLEIPPLRLEAQVPAADRGPGSGGFGPGFPFGRGGAFGNAFGGADPFAEMVARMRQMGFGGTPFGGMFGARRQVLSQPLTLEVRERPAAATADWFLPAEEVRLVEEWSTDTFRVGEPATRSVTLLARGLTGAQLPELVLPDAPGVKQYVEDSGRQTVARDDGAVTGSRTLLSVIPTRAGTVDLPEIRVAWWDVAAEQERVAVLPARSLTVLPAAGGQMAGQTAGHAAGQTAGQAAGLAPGAVPRPTAVAATDGEPVAGVSPLSDRADDPTVPAWLRGSGAGIAAGAGLLLLGAGGLLLYRRRRTSSGDRIAALRAAERELDRACREGRATAALEALILWGRACWPDAPPRGAMAVAERLQAEALRQAVQALTRHLYGDAGAAGGQSAVAARQQAELDALRTAFRAARRHAASGAAASGLPDPVPALYPAAGGRA